MLVIVNKQATLPFRCTRIGFTSKGANDAIRLAGKHGEGLKASASVLARNNCSFAIHYEGCVMRYKSGEADYKSDDVLYSRKKRICRGSRMKRLLKSAYFVKTLKVSRRTDVIQMVEGLPRFEALKFFLRHSHVEVPAGIELSTQREYQRFTTRCGDLLWPSTPSKDTEHDLRGAAYVCGIWWEKWPNQRLYGIDLHNDSGKPQQGLHPSPPVRRCCGFSAA